MSKNVKYMDICAQTEVITFESVQSLYEDMLSMQSFIVSLDENRDGKLIIEGATIYRHVELHKEQLHFHSNKFGGSELLIKGKLLSMKKTDNLDACISEYQLGIEGRKEPSVFLALKKNYH